MGSGVVLAVDRRRRDGRLLGESYNTCVLLVLGRGLIGAREADTLSNTLSGASFVDTAPWMCNLRDCLQWARTAQRHHGSLMHVQ